MEPSHESVHPRFWAPFCIWRLVKTQITLPLNMRETIKPSMADPNSRNFEWETVCDVYLK